MKFGKQNIKIALAGLTATALTISCGNESDDAPAVTGTGTGTGTKIVVGGSEIDLNSLAGAIPSSLALSIFPQTTSATLKLVGEEVVDPNADKTVQKKQEDQAKRLAGDKDVKCFNPDVFRAHKNGPQVTCYEFDSDMNPHKVSGNERVFGTADGTNGSGEACMVAFARGEVKAVVQRVDQAMELASGLVCQAKKANLDVNLDVDKEVDLTSSFKDAGGKFLKISAAKIKRYKDDSDGLRVFHTLVEFEFEDGRKSEMNLVNSISESGAEQKGVVFFRRDGKSGPVSLTQNPPPGGQDPNNSANKNDVMSINYHRFVDDDSKPRMRFEARLAQIVNDIEPFDDAGLVNYAALPAQAQNSDVHAIKFVRFDMNPDTNEGSLSYWMNPGGSYTESARGFLFNMSADSSGVISGCGVSGSTSNISIRKSLIEPSDANVLKPVKYWHPQGNQNIHENKDSRYSATGEGNAITEQCFKQNSTGVYAIDAAKTSHARGYEVIATAASKVAPPKPPKDGFKGEMPPLPPAK